MRLEIKSLNKSFSHAEGLLFGKKSSVQALNNVSLFVNEGESLGIVGESGSGKTTLAKILAGFMRADSGHVFLGENDLLALPRKTRSELVQMVFQDPFSSLNPKLLLGTQLIEAIRHPSGSSAMIQANRILDEVGLSSNHMKVYPHQLSGGQRQRFAIARALAASPKLLLSDEPVSSLDISIQAQIINLLNSLRERLRFSQILISHDLSVVANTCEHIAVMKDGCVVESGPVDQILHQPKTAYTRRLLAVAPVV